jgi:hypothetical protein
MQIEINAISYSSERSGVLSKFSRHRSETVFRRFVQKVGAAYREAQKTELPAKIQRTTLTNNDRKISIARYSVKIFIKCLIIQKIKERMPKF